LELGLVEERPWEVPHRVVGQTLEEGPVPVAASELVEAPVLAELLAELEWVHQARVEDRLLDLGCSALGEHPEWRPNLERA
jgi:hypothetical protein